MEKKEREKDVLSSIINVIMSNYWTFFILILALGGCIYTWGQFDEAQDRCNAYWMEQVEIHSCDFCGALTALQPLNNSLEYFNVRAYNGT